MMSYIRNLWSIHCVIAGLVLALAAAAAPVRDAGDFVYVQDLDRHFVMQLGGKNNFGQLDQTGNFVPSHLNLTGAQLGFMGDAFVNLNMPISKDGSKPVGGIKVYEFRSGRLIPGKMMPDGNFVPEMDGKVVKFEGYKYNPEGPRIYNLPGYFIRRDKLEERRKWLAEHVAEDPDFAKEKAKLDAAVAGKK